MSHVIRTHRSVLSRVPGGEAYTLREKVAPSVLYSGVNSERNADVKIAMYSSRTKARIGRSIWYRAGRGTRQIELLVRADDSQRVVDLWHFANGCTYERTVWDGRDIHRACGEANAQFAAFGEETNHHSHDDLTVGMQDWLCVDWLGGRFDRDPFNATMIAAQLRDLDRRTKERAAALNAQYLTTAGQR